MGFISRMITRAAVGAVVDSIEQSSNQNSPYYNNGPGGFVVCTNCAFTIEGGMPNCPRCGAPAAAPQYAQQPPMPNPNMQPPMQYAPNTQPAPPQASAFCGACGAVKTNPGPCAYCGK